MSTIKKYSRRIMGFFLTAFLLVGIFPVNSQADGLYFTSGTARDIKGHWAESQIQQGMQKGFINGFPDGTFKPDAPVTRAQFAKMINAALGITASRQIAFSDVPVSEWYYNDVAKGVGATYIAGYDDNRFKPDDYITRQEAAVIIARIVPGVYNSGGLNTFSDRFRVSDWAQEAMNKTVARGYMGAYNDGLLHPADQLTRAQTAKILMDILSKERIVKSKYDVGTSGTSLSNSIYTGNITVTKDVADGDVSIKNCTVLGTLIVNGGGMNSIKIENSRIAKAVVERKLAPVRVEVSGASSIAEMSLAANAAVECVQLTGGAFGDGINKLSIAGSASATLKGKLNEVSVDGYSANVYLEKADVSKFVISQQARATNVSLDRSSTIKEAAVNAESNFYGDGTISRMIVGANKVRYSKQPQHVQVLSNVTDRPVVTDQQAPNKPNFNSDKPALLVDTSRVGSSISLRAKASRRGTIYAVALERDRVSPDETQIKEGKDAQGFTLPYNQRKYSSIYVDSPTTLTFTGLDEKKDYTVYAVLYSDGVYSTIYNSRVTATVPTSMLNALSVDAFKEGEDKGTRISLEPSFSSVSAVTNYKVTMPFATSKVLIKAGSSGVSAIKFAEGSGAFAPYTKDQMELPIKPGDEKTIRIQVLEDGKRATIYTLKIIAKGNTDNKYKFAQSSAVQFINGGSANEKMPLYTFDAGHTSLDIEIALVDKDARVTSSQIFFNSGDHKDGIWKGHIKGLSNGDTREVSYTVTSHGVSETVRFKIEISK